jgi:hypothetical protein
VYNVWLNSKQARAHILRDTDHEPEC